MNPSGNYFDKYRVWRFVDDRRRTAKVTPATFAIGCGVNTVCGLSRAEGFEGKVRDQDEHRRNEAAGDSQVRAGM
jgi:hypothetical protein